MSTFTIYVKTSAGEKFGLQINSLDETVASFKTRLAEVSGIPADSQRLIFRGHVLKDIQTFHEIKKKHQLESGQTMHVVRSASAAHRSSASSSQSGAAPQAGALGQQTGQSPQQGGLGMPGVGGMGGFGDMADMQRQLLQNPEQMQAMLNSPIMDSIMNNPELARSMMMANPQLRELIERNPEVGHLFNDPSTFRQMMQIARNPSLMNEMMRNTDRQMANIEMMPGGFDALRRMHENIQAPLMDATAGFANPNADAANNADNTNAGRVANGSDNPFTSLFQNTPSNEPMPNPWAPNNGVQPSTTAQGGAPGDGSANVFASLFQGMGGTQGSGNIPRSDTAPGTTPGGGGNPSTLRDAFESVPGVPAGMDANQMMQFLENPMMQQMMQQVLSDPQMMESMIASNPQLQSLMQTNPQMAQMLRNPAIVRSFLNPDVMRSVMQLRNAMEGAGAQGTAGVHPPATTPRQNAANPAVTTTQPQAPGGNAAGIGMQGASGSGTGATGNTPQLDLNSFATLLNARLAHLQGTGQAPEQEMSQQQLEEMYSSQLAQLRDMGFLDTNMCVQALRQSQGNVALAVEHLLARFGGS